MKHRRFFAILLGAGALGLAACGSSASTARSASSTTVDTSTTSTSSGSAHYMAGMSAADMANMTPEQRMEATMTRLFAGITLTDAAKAKATTILKAYTDSNATIADRQSPDGMAKMQGFNKGRNDALKALLANDAEKAKFDSNTAPRGRRGGGR